VYVLPIEFYNIIQQQEPIRMFESFAEAWNTVTNIGVLLQLPFFSTEMAIFFCCNYREKH
jgi:hypothetical protein